VAQAAAFLPRFERKYPWGWEWLERRLGDVDAGRARLFLSTTGEDLAGFAIDTPKGLHRCKLSTFVVDPRRRQMGVGSTLLRGLRRHWIDQDIDCAHVTIDDSDEATKAFFALHGFQRDPAVLIPYGPGRFDGLWRWAAADDPLAHAPAVH
jgi:ribosomal protein S18 acetylase RimI-like enzyme